MLSTFIVRPASYKCEALFNQNMHVTSITEKVKCKCNLIKCWTVTRTCPLWNKLNCKVYITKVILDLEISIAPLCNVLFIE